MRHKININSVLAELDLIKSEIDCNEKLLHVYHIFESNYNLPGIIIIKNGSFYQMLSKPKFFQVMSKQYMFDLFSRRSLQFFFDDHYFEDYLILDQDTTILEASRKALERNEKARYEPIIVYISNTEYRLLPFHSLLLAQNEIQTTMLGMITEANEFKKDVFRIVTHDLRNPLSVVIGFSNLIIEKKIEKEHVKQYAQYINLAAINMNNLINDFLVAAINDSTDFNLNYTLFNVTECIKSILIGFKNMAEAKQMELIFNSSDLNIILNADKNKFTEVLQNLVSNAIKYSPLGSIIYVDNHLEDGTVIIKVKDEGPGLTENDKKNVFKKFQKLSAKPTGGEPSTGLGLYISKRIIDKHEGEIWVESEFGFGSTFNISLPLSIEKVSQKDTHELLRF